MANTRAKELTKAELQIMQILWAAGPSFVNEIIDRIPEPKPAYNTISTIVRILERKGFAGHISYGKSHKYYPLIEKEEYTGTYMKSVLSNFFGDSVSSMVSFFTRTEDISPREMDEIMRILKENSAKKEKV